MTGFWAGFEKRAYDYEGEADELEDHFHLRSQATPISKKRGAGAGALGGGLTGGLAGGLAAKGGVKGRMVGAGLGALGGGLLGAGMGVLSAIEDRLGIERAQRIMQMEPERRRRYLKKLARDNEISEKERHEWNRHLDRELNEERRHKERMGGGQRQGAEV